jgi:hypothetical protein
MDMSRHIRGQHRFGRWSFVAALAAAVLGVGAFTTTASAGYSGPPDFQSMGGGVGTTVPNGTGSVYTSVAVGTTVYIGGDFQLAGGAAIGPVAKWTGTAWAAVGTPADGPSGLVLAMATDGTNLYVGGDFGVFQYAPGSSTWTDLNWPNFAMALAWYDDGTNAARLVAAGETVNSSGCRFGSYNGANWTNVTDITHSTQSCGLYALAVMDHVLYVGGEFTDKGATAANNLLAYDGAADTWSAVPGATGNGVNDQADTGAIFALSVDSPTSTLFIGGTFSNASGTAVNAIAAYHADAYSDVSNAATLFNTGSEVDSLLLVNGGSDLELLAGGNFVFTGGTSSLVSTIVGGTGWVPGGTATDGLVDTLLLLGPESLLIGGEFTTAYSIATGTPVPDTMGVATFAPAPIPPTWNGNVTITGTPKIGNVLTAHFAATGDPIPTIAYQWFRCDSQLKVASASTSHTKRFLPSDCTEIKGATKTTYTVTTADVGKFIGVYAFATNLAGSTFNVVGADVPVPAAPTTTTTTTTTTVASTTTTTAPPTTEPTLPATGSNSSLPWTALAITGLGVALLIPARRRWLR